MAITPMPLKVLRQIVAVSLIPVLLINPAWAFAEKNWIESLYSRGAVASVVRTQAIPPARGFYVTSLHDFDQPLSSRIFRQTRSSRITRQRGSANLNQTLLLGAIGLLMLVASIQMAQFVALGFSYRAISGAVIISTLPLGSMGIYVFALRPMWLLIHQLIRPQTPFTKKPFLGTSLFLLTIWNVLLFWPIHYDFSNAESLKTSVVAITQTREQIEESRKIELHNGQDLVNYLAQIQKPNAPEPKLLKTIDPNLPVDHSARYFRSGNIPQVLEAAMDFLKNEQHIGRNNFQMRARVLLIKQELIMLLRSASLRDTVPQKEREKAVQILLQMLDYKDGFDKDSKFPWANGIVDQSIRYKAFVALLIIKAIHPAMVPPRPQLLAPVRTEEENRFYLFNHLIQVAASIDPIDFPSDLQRWDNLKKGARNSVFGESSIHNAQSMLIPYMPYILKSAKQFNVPPDHLALILMTQKIFKIHASVYSLGDGASMMEQFFPKSEFVFTANLVEHFPERLREIIFPDYMTNYLAGVIGGGYPTQGLMEIRSARIREIQPWGRFGLDVSGWSERRINIALLDPELSIEAMAAMLRYGANHWDERMAQSGLHSVPSTQNYSFSSSLNHQDTGMWGPAWAIDLFSTPTFGQTTKSYGVNAFNAIFDIAYSDQYIPYLPDIYRLVLATGFFSDQTVSTPKKISSADASTVGSHIRDLLTSRRFLFAA